MQRLLTILSCVGLLGMAGQTARAEETPKSQAALERAIQRGVDFFVKTQKKDGSWGSPATNLHDIFAPIPGSQRAFQVASAGLAVSALVEVGGDAPEVTKAIERGAAFLLKRHAVRRIRTNTLYNTWSLAYALEAFARLLEREKDEARRAPLLKAARSCVSYLDRFEFVEGGWGYYNFSAKTKDPGPGATSFTTATVLIAMKMAADQGVEVPPRLVRRGIKVIRACERPNNAFTYAFGSRYWASIVGINEVKGSLARTPVCLLAMRDWGEEIAQARFVKGLDDLEKHGHFLRIARKYPIPHETWYQNSGYFCFYGYYYAALCFDLLPADKRRLHQANIARHLVPLQEEDGSWWDYQLFNYHKVYGTGYVLLALGRCRAK